VSFGATHTDCHSPPLRDLPRLFRSCRELAAPASPQRSAHSCTAWLAGYCRNPIVLSVYLAGCQPHTLYTRPIEVILGGGGNVSCQVYVKWENADGGSPAGDAPLVGFAR